MADPVISKPAHVAIPTPPKPPTNIDPDRLVREMEKYNQQLTLWLQLTLGPIRDAINYLLDQAP